MTNQLLRTAKQALLAFAVATIFAACDPCDGTTALAPMEPVFANRVTSAS